jgi:hypothetical protein
MHVMYLTHLILLGLISLTVLCEENKYWRSVYNFLLSSVSLPVIGPIQNGNNAGSQAVRQIKLTQYSERPQTHIYNVE